MPSTYLGRKERTDLSVSKQYDKKEGLFKILFALVEVSGSISLIASAHPAVT